MITIEELTSQILAFRDDRNWAQFHKPKDILLSLVLEAGELAEHVQWKTDAEFADYLESHRTEIGHELADVLYWVLLISHDFGINLKTALKEKLEINAKKYPVEKAKDSKQKYSQF